MTAWLRGLALVIWTYGLMAVMGLAFAPLVLARPGDWALRSVKLYVPLVLGAARILCGLRVEVRGEVPRGEVIVAAKHQSFLDILILLRVLERPRFVMKQSLLWAPVLGFYARKIGCVAVDRAAGARALRAMVAEAAGGSGQMVIYPQGTRVAPGATAPWKGGAAALYAALSVPCVPAATNAGVFWPRKGVARHPGTAVVTFLDPIPLGVPAGELMRMLRARIEAESDALLAEARKPRG